MHSHAFLLASVIGNLISHRLVDDLEQLPHPEPLPAKTKPARGKRPDVVQLSPQLGRFVGCFAAVVGGLGDFAASTDQASLVTRCLSCLANRVPAAISAERMPSTSASELCAFANDCVMRLAGVLRDKIGQHHAFAACILLSALQVSQSMRTPALLELLDRHAKLIRLEGKALPAAAIHCLWALAASRARRCRRYGTIRKLRSFLR